jgi:3-isopropylmalate/(R)-2-methylmalate dehydratase small subunit
MEKFTELSSTVVPLPLNDIDTDMIIPAQYLTSVSRSGYGENLFRRLRDSSPDFPLNLPKFKEAKILAAGNNFGCGSSREHAVWALLGAGIKVVISSSFADIFSNNSGKNGLVLITVSPADLKDILEKSEHGTYSVTVKLEKQILILPDGKEINFPFDPFRKHCILNGLDDLDYLLSKRDLIAAYRAKNKSSRFFDTGLVNN